MPAKKKSAKPKPTPAQLRSVYDALRAYCKRERADTDNGSPAMVAKWHRICRMVGVDP